MCFSAFSVGTAVMQAHWWHGEEAPRVILITVTAQVMSFPLVPSVLYFWRIPQNLRPHKQIFYMKILQFNTYFTTFSSRFLFSPEISKTFDSFSKEWASIGNSVFTWVFLSRGPAVPLALIILHYVNNNTHVNGTPQSGSSGQAKSHLSLFQIRRYPISSSRRTLQ